MLYGTQWPFSASKRTVSGVSGGFHFGSSRGATPLVSGGDLLSMELGARLKLLEQLRVHTYLAAGPERISLNNWAFRACLADMPNCLHCSSGLEEMALHTFYNCEWVHPFWSHVVKWMAWINPKQLVQYNVGYVVDNTDFSYQDEKCVARMVIWETRNKGLYYSAV